jgi:hypothetical protein
MLKLLHCNAIVTSVSITAANQFAARIMTVRSVARMDGVDLVSLLAELNRAAVHQPTR